MRADILPSGKAMDEVYEMMKDLTSGQIVQVRDEAQTKADAAGRPKDKVIYSLLVQQCDFALSKRRSGEWKEPC